jgi:2-amino-4-hydroxy-6-hydroxymethyldihydropteridine diphosphokinase
MTLYLSLGSNLGDKNLNLQKAIHLIAEKIGIFSAISSIYETEPWGFESPNTFLNRVVAVETDLNPFEILTVSKDIEKETGRTEKTQKSYQDRVIDIDLILYGDLIIQSEDLQLPHPLFHQRRFVLEPLSEIAPNLIHPVMGESIANLLKQLQWNADDTD